jgi:hypothetical protein
VAGLAVVAGWLWMGCPAALGAEPAAGPESSAPALEPIDVGTPVQVEVYPPQFKLQSQRRSMHLIVTGRYADGREQDLTRAATFASSNDQVCTVQNGVVLPLSDGQAEVKVSVGGAEVGVPVDVSGQLQPDPVSFQFETLVALSKAGCNQGACHGAPSGKGGFRLSLRAYDPTIDTLTLIREAYNRRTNVEDPDASLILKKPLMEIPHGGGRRMTRGDASHAILRNWIAEGLRIDPPEAAVCTKVDVYPRQRVLHRPAHTQQLVVLATFSDGSVRDVTSLAVFSSSDEAVASVSPQGLVVGHDRGEAAVLVRFLEHMETSYLMFLKDLPGFQWNSPREKNFIDHLVYEKLEKLQILPSESCTDDEFIRRAYLDVIGLLPSLSEVENFLADPDKNKRERLLNDLLERPEYADFWALKWGDLLRINNAKVSPAGVQKFRHWLVQSIRNNVPYDQFVRDLITATGSTFDHPAANYFRTASDANDCTETTSQLFLGIRIQCAKCHNHPFERWTQDNYYGISAFFNRVQRKPSPNGSELVVWVARSGEVTQPRTSQQMMPWLPLTGPAELTGDDDRRLALADWLAQPDNPFFAQAEVNRVWGYLFGRGIVEPVDDFRASNPPSNAALLDALARDFVEHGFDRKHLIRTILKSGAYQASSRSNEFNKNDEKYFSHARTRLLSAEQLLDAICHVTGVEEKFPGLPSGTKAVQLPSPDINHQFLKVFGQPPREMACQCERSNESNLSQALQMINGPLIHGKLRDGNNRIRQLASAGKSDSDIIRELYLAAVCRPPVESELQAALDHLSRQPDRLQGLEDVCWAILNTKEFLFQH